LSFTGFRCDKTELKRTVGIGNEREGDTDVCVWARLTYSEAIDLRGGQSVNSVEVKSVQVNSV